MAPPLEFVSHRVVLYVCTYTIQMKYIYICMYNIYLKINLVKVYILVLIIIGLYDVVFKAKATIR